MYKSIIHNNEGISVILSVVILAAMVGLVITIASVSQGVTSTNRAIESSEIAFYAAESAAELTVYEIVRNDRGLDIVDVEDEPLDVISGATWNSEVRLSTTTPGLCSAPEAKPVCTNSLGAITNPNPLEVTLNPNESFQLDLNINLAPYPDRVQISWGGGATTEVVIAGMGSQTIETASPVMVPQNPSTIDPSDGYRFRITNLDASAVTYTISPNGGGASEVPLGLRISTVGSYRGAERRLDLTRPSWLVY